MKFNLVATTPMGIEAIVAKEVQDLGYETKVRIGLKLLLPNFQHIHLKSYLKKQKK